MLPAKLGERQVRGPHGAVESARLIISQMKGSIAYDEWAYREIA